MQRKEPKYLDWVRTLECAECGREGPSVAHHVKGSHHLSGAGMKAPDIFSMPLCVECHNRHHTAPEGWKERQDRWLVETLILAVTSDMLVFDGDNVKGMMT